MNMCHMMMNDFLYEMSLAFSTFLYSQFFTSDSTTKININRNIATL